MYIFWDVSGAVCALVGRAETTSEEAEKLFQRAVWPRAKSGCVSEVKYCYIIFCIISTGLCFELQHTCCQMQSSDWSDLFIWKIQFGSKKLMPQIKNAQNIWTDFTHDKSAVGSKTGNCKHLPHFGLNFGDVIVHLHKKQCYDHKLGFKILENFFTYNTLRLFLPNFKIGGYYFKSNTSVFWGGVC